MINMKKPKTKKEFTKKQLTKKLSACITDKSIARASYKLLKNRKK